MAEYYCYRCGQKMTEVDENTYSCADCNINYNTEKYKLEKIRIHKNLRHR